MIPKVSILIPLFNGEKYISDAINSALKQTWKNIEIIVVDDGSNDDSFNIVSNFSSDIIKVYRQDNLGACAARNKAFELSTGDYIQYLDADDLLSENKIEDQLKHFKIHDDSIISSCKWKRYHNGSEIFYKRREIDRSYENPIDWLVDSWMGKGAGQTSIWLTPRSIIKKSGKWNETVKKNQDGEFFCRVILNSKAIIYSEDACVYYRFDENSLSNVRNFEASESLLHTYELYVAHLQNYIQKEEIRKALASNFSRYYYSIYPNFPQLLDRAEENLEKIGVQKFPPVGSKQFKLLGHFLGLKNALKLRSYINNCIH
ncbi:MAG: glycosyltransferase [Bacteroidota bacterium]|nr:glycosyltransferase [Bacteroidota bacterium]